MRRLILAALALIATPAAAKVNNVPVVVLPDLSAYVTKADLSALAPQSTVDAIAAAMPKPGALVPIEQVGGAAGNAVTFMRSDAKPSRITRAGSCVIAATAGTCDVTWATPFAVGTTVNIVITPINPTAQPIICNLASVPTITSVSLRCWFARTLPSTITVVTGLVSYDIFGLPATGMTVQVVGIPSTQ